MEDADRALFEAYGLAGALKQIATNPALGQALKQTIAASGLTAPPADAKAIGNMLFSLASSLNDARANRRELVARYVAAGKIKSTQQLNAAIDYFKKKTPDVEVDTADFEKSAGVGIDFSEAQIKAHAGEVVAAVAAELTSQRYLYPVHTLLAAAKDGDWRWADGRLLKEAVDAAVLAALGPKNADDERREAEARAANKKKGGRAEGGGKEGGAAAAGGATSPAAGGAGAAAAGAAGSAGDAASPVVGVHAAGTVESTFTARELAAAVNSPRLVEEHLKVTKGVIRTRFPPEPNGFLHIGHAKSMNLNFEGAFRALGVDKGETVFRYDDTNPDAETKEYIDNMAENVAWMGWKPCATTHSSDYFPQLYEFALELIRRGKAYVCHQSKEDMEASREIARARDGRSPNSPWRDRPVEESLREFDSMRMGKYKEGEATLRLKIDMLSANPTLWDPVAYRIKYTPHPHTGDRWCIYPSYDFSHSLIDSLEHIDYSLCTLEFEVRRELYYWTLEQLDIWRPHVWEFARLNITHVQLSKRKILKLVMEKTVRGWDDPRLPTIIGLRRRGYTSEAINAFCRDIGVTRNDNTVMYGKLEHHVRNHLDQIARRDFVVLKPLKLVLTNVPEEQVYKLTAPDFPRDAAAGSHELTLTRVVYIEEDDFREVDDKDYFGLAPGKTAGLRYAGYVKVTGFTKDPASGRVTEVQAEYDHDRSAPGKVKGNLHFVSGNAPGVDAPVVEVRLYDHLFTTESPGSTGDWESEINRGSETVLHARANPSLLAPGRVKVLDHFQFERVGYFVADQDCDLSTGANGAVKRLVFNQTVGLKEAVEVKKVKGHA